MEASMVGSVGPTRSQTSRSMNGHSGSNVALRNTHWIEKYFFDLAAHALADRTQHPISPRHPRLQRSTVANEKYGRLNVRNWPLADMTQCTAHVRFRR